MTISIEKKSDEDLQRANKRAAFLKEHQAEINHNNTLSNDASFRTYYRLSKPANTLLMDSPAAHEPVAPFADLSNHLASLGLSAPKIQAEDRQNNFLLIEDFGDNTFSSLLDKGHDPYDLYELAIDTLAFLHNHEKAIPDHWGAYTQKAFIEETGRTINWYYTALKGYLPTESLKKEWVQIWQRIFSQLPAIEQTLVLRDYHCDNLMVINGKQGVKACGLLDFQDGLIGPSPYDLVSLLENDRRAVPNDLQEKLLKRYLSLRSSLENQEDFMLWYRLLGMQRQMKILGLFYRLPIRDYKSSYLRFIPQVCFLINQNLGHSLFVELNNFVQNEIGEIKPIENIDYQKIRSLNIKDDLPI